jgi:hypothetical protein
MKEGKNIRYDLWFTLEIILRISFSTNNIFSNIPSDFYFFLQKKEL